MADRIKDEADLKLESMFRIEPVADEGFSVSVMSRVRRRMWVRRLSMPVALGIGLAIGGKPLYGIVSTLPGLISSIAGSSIGIDKLPIDGLPELSTILLGAALLMAMVTASKLLED